MSAESAPVVAPAEAVGSETVVVAEAATEVEASVAVSEAAVAEPTLTPALSQGERERVAERIRASALLPPAIRDCLARVVEVSGESAAGGPTRVPLDELVRAVEEAMPDFLRVDRRRAAAPPHPAGDVFFSGDPSSLSDQQAEEIARAQLAKSGLLRGQRVRVAD